MSKSVDQRHVGCDFLSETFATIREARQICFSRGGEGGGSASKKYHLFCAFHSIDFKLKKKNEKYTVVADRLKNRFSWDVVVLLLFLCLFLVHSDNFQLFGGVSRHTATRESFNRTKTITIWYRSSSSHSSLCALQVIKQWNRLEKLTSKVHAMPS